jgi:predicted phage terminase large subunit-like protein
MDKTTTLLIRTQFLAFTMKAFATVNGRSLGGDPDPYLRLLAERLGRVASGELRRLVVSLPPRHAKTFMGSICLSAWILAHKPSARIVLLSYGQDLADKIAYSIRKIMRSDWYRHAFRTRIERDRAKVSDFVTLEGGGVRSLSIDGGVTGIGGDYIIIDDPVQIKHCDDKRRLDRVNGLFDDEIMNRFDNPRKGGVVIVAHRISQDDLPGYVLQKGGWKELKLPLIAPRARRYEFNDGTFWERKKGELLRPDAFRPDDIARLRASKHPGFETLHQQNPNRDERLRLKAEHFPTFASTAAPSDLPKILSIEPGQKGGPTNSFGVIQVFAVDGETYYLLDQWREQSSYRDFRPAVWSFIRRHRPSAVLIEATGQGPALKSDIREQEGMKVVMVTPVESKLERLRRHRRIIRAGRVQLAEHAIWRDDFLTEAIMFPYGAHDDQMDALSQFLDWIVAHPNPHKRPPMAVAQGTNSQGRPMSLSGGSTVQIKGAVLAPNSRQMPNSPFVQPTVGVSYGLKYDD